MSNIIEFPSDKIKLRENFEKALNKALSNVKSEYKETLVKEGLKTLKKYEDDFYTMRLELGTELRDVDLENISNMYEKDVLIKLKMVTDIAVLNISKIIDDIKSQNT